ncbi:MAG: MFS transporter [Chloroflexi bacterium]|nr:MFS transporter [Chloroflexota bacterium]
MHYADYRTLWLSSAVAAASLWAMLMARGWLVFEISGSGLAVGAVTFAAMAPWALAPIGGAFADRFDRGRLVLWGRVALMGLAFALAALAFTDVIAIWHLVVIAAASGVVRIFEIPAEQALIPNVVDRDSLLNAITLASLARHGSRFIGPLVGAPLIAGVGPGWLFVLGAVFYGISALVFIRFRLRSSGGLAGTEGGFRAAGRGIREAVRYVGQHRPLMLVFALTMFHCMLVMSFDSLLPIFATDALGRGSGAFGALLAGVGAGALVGTLILSFVHNGAVRGATFLGTGVLSGAAMLWLAVASGPVTAVAAAVVVGAAQAAFMALSATFIQEVVSDALRGRVMSLYVLLAAGTMATMIFGNGALADVINVRILLVASPATFIALVLAWSLSQADLRAVYRTGRLPAVGSAPA